MTWEVTVTGWVGCETKAGWGGGGLGGEGCSDGGVNSDLGGEGDRGWGGDCETKAGGGGERGAVMGE